MYYQAYPFFRNQESGHRQHNIVKVNGEGTVIVQPDRATVRIGVITENTNLKEAQQLNAEKTTAVIRALVENGIPRENIQTTEFRINPQYDFQNGTQVFRGYQVTNQLTITIDQIERVGEIVDIAVDNGANTVNNIDFSVSNQTQHYLRALRLAIRDAQEKVMLIAETLGVSISETPHKLKEITNTATEPPRPLVLGVSTESAYTTPIEAGQFRITAMVEAEFRF